MIIASNSPASIPKIEGCQPVQLGDRLDDANIIVLLLEKNWGTAGTSKINALRHWISQYPKDVSCYLIGCEMTIPDKAVNETSLSYYKNEGRDEAIVALCTEVLSRSNSIGVRDEVTTKYLIDILGFDKSQIDMIYKKDDSDNATRLAKFIDKNNFPSNKFNDSFLRFQQRPEVIYERSPKFNKVVTLSRPYKSYEGASVRLNCDFTIDGAKQTLWCETSTQWSDYLLDERADAFICAILPFAIRAGKDIVSEAPITEHFYHNLKEILIPQLCAHDHRLYETNITARLDSSPLPSGNAVATAMSCGVDSLYTAKMYLDSEYKSINLTHLYCGNYLYGNDGPIYERATQVSQKLSLPLVTTRTNVNEIFSLPHLYTHFFKTMFGVLSLRKLFKTYLYSSAEDFSHFTLKNNSISPTAQYELLLLNTFSCPDFQVLTGGGRSERLEKTEAICDFDVAKEFLNVCLYPNEDKNCGKCAKCIRTLLMIDMLKRLDDFSEVFDIESYTKNRIECFVYLVKLKHSSMLSRVYDYFSKTEPELISEAERIVSNGNP